MSQRMEHVIVGDAVLASGRLDVHPLRLRPTAVILNIC